MLKADMQEVYCDCFGLEWRSNMLPLISKSARKWPHFPERENVLLFAQSLEEKLFDYTIDSYKARALNLHTCVFEVHALAKQVLSKRVSPGALTPVIEELVYKIRNDPVLEKKEQERFSEYAQRIISEKENAEAVVAIAEALHIELGGFYWKKLLLTISEEVRKKDNNRIIVALADSFICEAELERFHRRYIFYMVHKFFWRKKIKSPSDVDDFLKSFESPSRKYSFVFKASSSLRDVKEFGEHVGLNILDSPPEIEAVHPQAKDFFQINESLPVFALTNEITARDSLSARLQAELQMEMMANVYTFHVHQQHFLWQPVALCLNSNKKFEGLLKTPASAMSRCYYSSVDGSRDNINKMIEVLRGLHFRRSDTYVFVKALDYHRAALEAETAENQLVDLWAALEGFLPPPGEDSARITHYVNLVLPCLTLTYAEKLFRYVSGALEECSLEVGDIVRSISGSDPFFDNVVRILVTSECGDLREKLFKALDDFPLLRFRCRFLGEGFKDAESTHDTLRSHRDRLKWHIQRIYSTRNQIVHSADSLPYLNTLVENLHVYIDALISSIARVGLQSHSKTSIAGAIKLISISEHTYLKGLKGNSDACSVDNFRKIIFGYSNPLSPFHDHFCISSK